MKKVLLIINPSAGMGTARDKLYSIIDQLTVGGCEVTVYPILPAYNLTCEDILGKAKGRFDVVACFGGDGTMSHMINGYMNHGYDLPLGYFPAGSTNDFAKSVGIPETVAGVCDAILKGSTFTYDVGRLNDTFFNYVAAFGAFTAVSYDTNQDVKNAIGHAAYILGGIMALPDALTRTYKLKVEHDGETHEGTYIFGAVSNSTSVGGFKLPNVDRIKLDDGVFEIMLIKAAPTIFDMQGVLGALATGSVENKYIEVFQTDEVRLTSDKEIAWTLDGEFGGSQREAHLRLYPEAVKILVP
ncbi:MAG: YegS/Rv2252/BmrU family lipid kinase [Eubacterium sp.]|nr:YegS/Rv2252/BmrU family lipid kinase [Eubacterium sp.]